MSTLTLSQLMHENCLYCGKKLEISPKTSMHSEDGCYFYDFFGTCDCAKRPVFKIVYKVHSGKAELHLFEAVAFFPEGSK